MALKKLIRSELSRICHGASSAATGHEIYSYKFTLREFLKRYKGKDTKTKTGMIGELLCHIMLLHYNGSLKPASPFFNMEESSIKKGFDLILINTENKTAWIAEVKSGEVGKSTKAKKFLSLLNLAKADLEKRIPDSEATIWYSAIINVKVALESDSTAKEILSNFLAEFISASDAPPKPQPAVRAILVPVLFNDTKDVVDFSKLKAAAKRLNKKMAFAECMIFGIQKSTVKKVEAFLESELLP